MPTYEYQCAACGERFARQQSIEQHDRERRPPPCPKCRSAEVEPIFSPVFVKTVRKS